MQTPAKKAPRFSRYRQPYRCRICHKSTCSTGDARGVALCDACYDLAGQENEHNDNHGQEFHEECLFCRQSPREPVQAIHTVIMVEVRRGQVEFLASLGIE